MPKIIEYYFSPISPWTYLGHMRLCEIGRRRVAEIDVLPVDLGRLFPLTGGLPLAKRAPQRQAYRMQELKRWQKVTGLPLTLEPKHFPADANPAVAFITAAKLRGEDALALIMEILAACWADELDISDGRVLVGCANKIGLNGLAISDQAAKDETAAAIEEAFERAMARGVFGAPTYAVGDDLFWGQDRLDFLDRALAD